MNRRILRYRQGLLLIRVTPIDTVESTRDLIVQLHKLLLAILISIISPIDDHQALMLKSITLLVQTYGFLIPSSETEYRFGSAMPVTARALLLMSQRTTNARSTLFPRDPVRLLETCPISILLALCRTTRP